jgi:ParB-like chromosome segregation protein Spo0J
MEIKDLILKTEKIEWQKLHDLQPINLKNNYHSEKLKTSLKENGFSFSIYVWESKKDGKIYIIDGHARKDTLIELKAEGCKIPDKLSCTFLDIKNKKMATKYLLQVFNQKTNPINQESLNIWLEESDFILPDLNIDIDDLNIELDSIDTSEEEKDVAVEEADEVKQSHILEIECETEAEQEILYNRFLQEKLKVKIK